MTFCQPQVRLAVQDESRPAPWEVLLQLSFVLQPPTSFLISAVLLPGRSHVETVSMDALHCTAAQVLDVLRCSVKHSLSV
mmetsp:Transcript_9537/g.10710  ORF Transcript_9537/g.10710 Transcript_9537/m.10710 type:complete len:80 (-) Transcript_9537:174-413(-)